MSYDLISITLLLSLIVGSLSLRKLPLWSQFVIRLVLLAAISVLLLQHGESAIPVSRASAPGIDGFISRALTIAWWWIGAHLATELIALVRVRDHRLRGSRLFSDLLSGAIYLSAVLFIANSILDLPVKGLVATSGVIAIVIGLALQNTLADLFSGTAVGIERFFNVGDRISVSGSVEGVVTQMNWRSVWIQTDDDDLAAIPNSVIAKSQVINQGKPNNIRVGHIEFTCSNRVAPVQVIELMGFAVLLSDEIMKSPQASAEMTAFGSTKNKYQVKFHARSSAALGAANVAVVAEIDRQLRRSGWFDDRILADTDGGRQVPSPSWTLRGMSLFDGFDTGQIEELSKAVTVRALQPGDVLFSHGAEDSLLHVVARGVVELTSQRLGDISGTSDRIGVGDYIGDLHFEAGKTHSFDAVALTKCVIFDIDRATLVNMAAVAPALVPRFKKTIERRNEDLTEYKTKSRSNASESRTNIFTKIRIALKDISGTASRA